MIQFNGRDDQQLVEVRLDFSGGQNTRQRSKLISENQVEQAIGYDTSAPGKIVKDKGITLLSNLGTSAGLGLFGYEPDGFTFELLAAEDINLKYWQSGTAFTTLGTAFTAGNQTRMFKGGESGEGDVAFVTNGVNQWYRVQGTNGLQALGTTAGTGNDSPPLTAVGCYFRNRVWALKSNLGYFSDAFPADYASAFDTVTNAFRFSVGKEMAIVPMRDLGLIFFGSDAVWGLNPSVVPDPTTDKPEHITDIGCVAGKTAIQVGDDILYLAKDGVRGLFRTQQDKVQTGQSFPLSYIIKTNVDSLSMNYIEKATAIYWENKYILSVPVNSSTYNNQVWIYHPATQSWRVIDGWNVGQFATIRISGENRLYYINSNSGKVHRAFYGADNDGTAISSTLISREEDFKYPQQYKCGGELEIEVLSANSSSAAVSVYVSLDAGAWQFVGNVTLSIGAIPALPKNLPFNLADSSTGVNTFHLDRFGKFRTLRVKIIDSINSSVETVIYGYSLRTFLEEYLNE